MTLTATGSRGVSRDRALARPNLIGHLSTLAGVALAHQSPAVISIGLCLVTDRFIQTNRRQKRYGTRNRDK